MSHIVKMKSVCPLSVSVSVVRVHSLQQQESVSVVRVHVNFFSPQESPQWAEKILIPRNQNLIPEPDLDSQFQQEPELYSGIQRSKLSVRKGRGMKRD